MERGEVRWYTFQEPDKTRPVLILTRNSAIRYLNAVTVAPITTTIRDVPSEVKLSPEDGMPTDCAANFYNLQTVPKRKIGAWITTLSPNKLTEADQAIQFALGVGIEE
jgi:mRNA interferase MazF